MESFDKIFAILGRVIHIPMHQYARYFERYRQIAQTRPVTELAPPEVLYQFRAEFGSKVLKNLKRPKFVFYSKVSGEVLHLKFSNGNSSKMAKVHFW